MSENLPQAEGQNVLAFLPGIPGLAPRRLRRSHERSSAIRRFLLDLSSRACGTLTPVTGKRFVEKLSQSSSLSAIFLFDR